MSGEANRRLGTGAYCWRLERRDGVTIGLTTHDRDLTLDGLVYRASPGMTPSAITLSDRFDAGAIDISGALSSDAISARDLIAGRWDGAAIRLFFADWEDRAAAPVTLARGTVASIAVKGVGFEAEVRGPMATLDRPVTEQTSPACRAELGDPRCRVAMAGRIALIRIVRSAQETVEVEAADGNAYGYGRLRWITGANSGLESAILSQEGRVLRLREAPPFAAEPGDLVEISEGCDKRFETCCARFGNGENFRGEPHLPGIDLLTRYPGE